MTGTRSDQKQRSADTQDVLVTTHITKKRRIGGRSQRVQTAVFTVAIDILVSKGYEAFRITDVATRAGVNETSIYRRWGTKERLLIEALLSRAEEELPIADTGTLRSDLKALLRELMKFLRSPLGIALVQVGAISINHPELSNYRLKYWSNRISRIRLIFERAVARGEIPSSLDITSILELLVGPIYARMLFTGRPLDQELAERSVDIVLSAMSNEI